MTAISFIVWRKSVGVCAKQQYLQHYSTSSYCCLSTILFIYQKKFEISIRFAVTCVALPATSHYFQCQLINMSKNGEKYHVLPEPTVMPTVICSLQPTLQKLKIFRQSLKASNTSNWEAGRRKEDFFLPGK